MQLSRIIAFPFALLSAYLVYELYYNNRIEWSYYPVFPILALVAIYIFHHQINEIGWRKWPQKVDEVLQRMVNHGVPFIQMLSEEKRNLVYQSMIFHASKTEFTGMKVEDIPTDVMIMCTLPATLMSTLSGFPLLKEYNHVILYKHPFPSPAYKVWHSSETHHEDGVLLFSLEHLVPPYAQPSKYYNIAFHEWAKALRHHDKRLNEIFPEDFSWKSLEDMRLFNQTFVSAYVGLEDVDPRDAAITAYFTDTKGLQQQLPQLFKAFLDYFDPN